MDGSVSKYIRWQVLLTLLGIVLVATLLFYMVPERQVSPSSTPTPEMIVVQVRGGTYVEGLAGSPRYMNPLFSHFSDVDRDLCALIFEGMTMVNERNEIVPLLAERWETAEDGLTYTFYLRDSVRWQDGEPFTADDVVFTISLLQNPDFPGFHPYSELWRSVAVEKVDTYAVRFTLSEPYAPFLDYTTIGIVPQHVLADVPVVELDRHPFNYSPVGTGLFKVKELTPDHVLLETNPYHRQWGETMLDYVEFKFYDSYEHVFAAYEAGEVMGMGRIPIEDLDRARANPNLQILSARLSGYGLIFLNLNHPDRPFFQDRRVRQALLYALDRQGIIDQALGGQGVVIHSPIMSHSWAYNPEIKKYAHALGRARSLLEEAGYSLPDPNQVTFGEIDPEDAKVRVKGEQQLAFTLLIDHAPEHVALAHVIAEQWAQVGVRADVRATDISDLALNYLQPRKFDAVLLEWPSQLDPDPYPMWHETQIEGSGQNYSGFVNRDASEAIEVARQLTDLGERTRLYYQFQDIFAEEVPAILLYQPVHVYGVDRQVRNVQIAPLFSPAERFRTIAQWALLEKEIPLSDWNAQVGDKLDRRQSLWYDPLR